MMIGMLTYYGMQENIMNTYRWVNWQHRDVSLTMRARMVRLIKNMTGVMK